MEMKNTINEALTTCKNLCNDTPKLIAVFVLLPLYFLESEKEIFLFVPDTSSTETVQSFGESKRPLLIIKGKSVFDEEAKYEVFVSGKKIIEAQNTLQGFFCLFLSYYIYMDIRTAKIVKRRLNLYKESFRK